MYSSGERFPPAQGTTMHKRYPSTFVTDTDLRYQSVSGTVIRETTANESDHQQKSIPNTHTHHFRLVPHVSIAVSVTILPHEKGHTFPAPTHPSYHQM
mmetsp:Transcript_23552/g.23799  ORF Transcript_23552/g.23799 Transcript_23552/m.23799 type:complete len:98 (+) Transcript_23552:662-955(+)